MGVLKGERRPFHSGELSDSYLFTWGKVLHTKQPRLAWSMSQGAGRQADTEYSINLSCSHKEEGCKSTAQPALCSTLWELQGLWPAVWEKEKGS